MVLCCIFLIPSYCNCSLDTRLRLNWHSEDLGHMTFGTLLLPGSFHNEQGHVTFHTDASAWMGEHTAGLELFCGIFIGLCFVRQMRSTANWWYLKLPHIRKIKTLTNREIIWFSNLLHLARYHVVPFDFSCKKILKLKVITRLHGCTERWPGDVQKPFNLFIYFPPISRETFDGEQLLHI